MFSESAELYDAIYATFKDYPAEARDIAALLRARHSRCHTVLDVACGTAEHARLLSAQYGFDVTGLDLDPAFVRIARAKLPGATVVEADMADFHLGRTFDAVLCLFSSIGYLKTLDRVEQALACFREHVAPGGVVVVEPWFPPGKLTPGHHSTREAEVSGVHVTRAARNEIEDRLSRLYFDYTIRDAKGTRQASEVHELGLFTVDEMLGAFSRAGLETAYEEQGLAGRGLYVARKFSPAS